MSTPRWILTAAALVLAGVAAQAADRKDNEARLAGRLEGRSAGEPVSCITALRSDKLEVLEDVALVYDAGKVIYVARPANPGALRANDVIVINRFGGQLCHTDVIRTVDRAGGYTTGVLFLEMWVPYRRPE